MNTQTTFNTTNEWQTKFDTSLLIFSFDMLYSFQPKGEAPISSMNNPISSDGEYQCRKLLTPSTPHQEPLSALSSVEILEVVEDYCLAAINAICASMVFFHLVTCSNLLDLVNESFK